MAIADAAWALARTGSPAKLPGVEPRRRGRGRKALLFGGGAAAVAALALFQRDKVRGLLPARLGRRATTPADAACTTRAGQLRRAGPAGEHRDAGAGSRAGHRPGRSAWSTSRPRSTPRRPRRRTSAAAPRSTPARSRAHRSRGRAAAGRGRRGGERGPRAGPVRPRGARAAARRRQRPGARADRRGHRAGAEPGRGRDAGGHPSQHGVARRRARRPLAPRADGDHEGDAHPGAETRCVDLPPIGHNGSLSP